jgi:branched-chain amino acid transport system substrate-binding protein
LRLLRRDDDGGQNGQVKRRAAGLHPLLTERLSGDVAAGYKHPGRHWQFGVAIFKLTGKYPSLINLRAQYRSIKGDVTMKKSAIFIVLFAIISLVICGCGKDDSSQIKVGVIAELTGDIPAVGASCKNAAEMAAAEINDAGGILLGDKQYKIKLIIEDNAGKADQSASSAQKLITQQKVTAIIGPNASRYALPAAEIAETSKVVLITPWSTAPKATLDSKTGAAKKYVFRACFIDPFQGRVLAKFTLDNLKLKKAAVLYDVASEYNKGIAEIFKEVYEQNGGRIVAFETYTTNDKDFSSQLTKIKKAAPEVIFLPNYYSEVPLQIQQAKRLGITVPFIGSLCSRCVD